MELTVENGIITACSWDCFGEDGIGKQQLSLDGLYIMTEDGPTWKAQSEALAAYVIEHQTVSQLADENGYAKDAIASVSINVSGFINGINECFFWPQSLWDISIFSLLPKARRLIFLWTEKRLLPFL